MATGTCNLNFYCGNKCQYSTGTEPPFTLFLKPSKGGLLDGYTGRVRVLYGMSDSDTMDSSKSCARSIDFNTNPDVWSITRPVSCTPTGKDRLNAKIFVRPLDDNGSGCPDEATDPTGGDPLKCQYIEIHTSCSQPLYMTQCLPSGQDGSTSPNDTEPPCETSDRYEVLGFCNISNGGLNKADGALSPSDFTCTPSGYLPLRPSGISYI